jgi:hypothetical protein
MQIMQIMETMFSENTAPILQNLGDRLRAERGVNKA